MTQSTAVSRPEAVRVSCPTASCRTGRWRQRARGTSHSVTWWAVVGKWRPGQEVRPPGVSTSQDTSAGIQGAAAATRRSSRSGATSRSELSTSSSSPVAAAAPEFTAAAKPPLRSRRTTRTPSVAGKGVGEWSSETMTSCRWGEALARSEVTRSCAGPGSP